MSRAAVLRLAAERGIEVGYGGEGSSFEVTLCAPDGHWFPEAGVHERVTEICGADGQDRPRDVWAAVLAELREGLTPEPCTDPECDWCGRGGES